MKIIEHFFLQGNEVDQLFSLLTQKFKSEIRTIEELKDKIVNSGIWPSLMLKNWISYGTGNHLLWIIWQKKSSETTQITMLLISKRKMTKHVWEESNFYLNKYEVLLDTQSMEYGM